MHQTLMVVRQIHIEDLLRFSFDKVVQFVAFDVVKNDLDWVVPVWIVLLMIVSQRMRYLVRYYTSLDNTPQQLIISHTDSHI